METLSLTLFSSIPLTLLALPTLLWSSAKIILGRSHLSLFERMQLSWPLILILLCEMTFLWGGPEQTRLGQIFFLMGMMGLLYPALLFWKEAQTRRPKLQIKALILAGLLSLWAYRQPHGEALMLILLGVTLFPLTLLYVALRKEARLMTRYYFFILGSFFILGFLIFFGPESNSWLIRLPGLLLGLVSLFFGNHYLGLLIQFSQGKIQFLKS